MSTEAQSKEWQSYKGLWLISLPSIIATMLEPISAVIDTALVGNFNTQALAALAVGTTVMSAFTWMFNFLIHAPIQSISEKISNRDYRGVASLLKLSIIICFFLSILLIVFLYPSRFYIYTFMNIRGEVANLCDEYFTVRLLGHFAILGFTVGLSILRGFAKVNLALLFIAISAILNVAISYSSLFVFDLGLTGVALGTVIGNALGFVLVLFYLFNLKELKGQILRASLEKDLALDFGSKSLNVFGRSFVLTTCFFICTKVSSSISENHLASHQILLQVWLFISFFTDGVATTANIIGARLFGKDNSGLLKIYKKTLLMGMQIGLVFTIMLFIFKSYFISLFTVDQKLIMIINEVWPLVAFTQIPLSVAYVYDGLIFGINKFSFLRRHMTIGFTIVFLPIIVTSYLQQSLVLVWLSLVGIGLYRLLSNFYCIRYTFKNS